MFAYPCSELTTIRSERMTFRLEDLGDLRDWVRRWVPPVFPPLLTLGTSRNPPNVEGASIMEGLNGEGVIVMILVSTWVVVGDGLGEGVYPSFMEDWGDVQGEDPIGVA